jgi:hypothetical protein
MKNISLVILGLAASVSLSVALAADTRAAFEKIAQVGDFGNDGASVERAKGRLDTRKVLREMERRLQNDPEGCGYENVVGTAKAMSVLSGIEWLNEDGGNPQALAILRRLVRAGEIKTIVGRYMTENREGNSYCDLYYFDVYSKDGYVLSLRWDFTD